ncbi:MAG TPA: patatin-like phospholipase family protein [Gemmatimonadales bacterium]|nr:patatin-like phospholipase family protein [Gemmatimonadales bacterium]
MIPAGQVAVALSGGGAKTAAHLGAVRALAAAGIAPSRYVGTSMGAVIATGLAAGLSPGEIAERLLAIRHRDVFAVDRTALIRGVWARALLKPDKLRRTLEGLLPVASFSDLSLPLSITATDLDSGEELIFGAGGEDVPLLDALCASCALPPFFPPFLLGGRRCADGGLREVVPLAVAARFPADLVVAVDVGSGFDMAPNPSGPRAPALLQLQNDAQRILMASASALNLALWRATPTRPRLLWIRPRVRLGETFATEQLQWYLAEGERAATAELAALRT